MTLSFYVIASLKASFLFTSRKAGQYVLQVQLGLGSLLAFWKPQFMFNLFETFEPPDWLVNLAFGPVQPVRPIRQVGPFGRSVEYVKPGDHRGDPRFISSPITAGDPYSGRGFLNQANKSQK